MYENILDILVRSYVSVINAKSILGRAVQDCGATPSTLSLRHLPNLIPRLERDIALFLEPEQRARLHVELQLISPNGHASTRSQTTTVRQEADIGVVRLRARQMCEDLGARSLSMHKVVTIVSELARNIVSYAGGGSVELIPSTNPVPKITIRAVDSGPGIPHLKSVLDGTWRSKTGLGQGLRGTQKLADRFDIETGADGTRVEVEVSV
jgi:serine/threonine-protein kinase RsbT